MDENIITTEQVAEVAEDVIVNADSTNVLDILVKAGKGVAIVGAIGGIAYGIYKLIEKKKQQKAEASEEDQSDANVIPMNSDEE